MVGVLSAEGHCAAAEEEDGDEEAEPVGKARGVVGPQTDVPVAPTAVDEMENPTHEFADKCERETQPVPQTAPKTVLRTALRRSATCQPDEHNQAKPDRHKPLNVFLSHKHDIV